MLDAFTVNDLFDWVVLQGWRLHEMHQVHISLEERFIDWVDQERDLEYVFMSVETRAESYFLWLASICGISVVLVAERIKLLLVIIAVSGR